MAAKPNLYPLVIDFDEGFSKDTTGFVMRCFRSLSRASTLDSLSSSFMCNAVNEANTIIPPPYSCNNSIDELSAAAARERPSNFGDGSIASLAHNHTTSDVSSLAAQSPLSPPKATSPTIEVNNYLILLIFRQRALKYLSLDQKMFEITLTKFYSNTIIDLEP